MDSLFNYSTLKCHLEKSTRSLFVILKNQSLNIEQIFEVESLLNWVSNKVEISSIFITMDDDSATGIDREVLNQLSNKQILKLSQKLQGLIENFYNLPQTVIFDLKNGTHNLASELSLGADIRIADGVCEVEFEHLSLGILPCSGGLSLLGKILSPAVARNWILSGAKIQSGELLNHGFLFKTYDSTNRTDVIKNLLVRIHKQAPVQRIQAKLGLFELIRTDFEKTKLFENQIAKAALISEDWRNKKNDEFMPAKNMGTAVKLSLIKTENEENPN